MIESTINLADTIFAGEGEPTGEFGGRLWDDVDDIEDIKGLSPKHSHAQTDKVSRARIMPRNS